MKGDEGMFLLFLFVLPPFPAKQGQRGKRQQPIWDDEKEPES